MIQLKILSTAVLLLFSTQSLAADPCAGKVVYCSDQAGFHAFPNADSCNYYSDSEGLKASAYCSLQDSEEHESNKCGADVAYCSDHSGFHAFPGYDSCNYYSDSEGLEAAPYCSK